MSIVISVSISIGTSIIICIRISVSVNISIRVCISISFSVIIGNCFLGFTVALGLASCASGCGLTLSISIGFSVSIDHFHHLHHKWLFIVRLGGVCRTVGVIKRDVLPYYWGSHPHHCLPRVLSCKYHRKSTWWLRKASTDHLVAHFRQTRARFFPCTCLSDLREYRTFCFLAVPPS